MRITVGQVERALETVASRLRPILDDRAGSVVAQAKSMLTESTNAFRESRRQRRPERPVRPWGFEIHPRNPLRFKETEVDQLRFRVDLFLSAYWIEEPAECPADLRVVVRVWSLDPHIYFREQWDAARMANVAGSDTGRVMLRVHFELANPQQAGPRYHLQIGGNAHVDELHWFPEAISVPRILHMPLDLMLASELIAATFYPDEYKDIRREPAWKGSLTVSQQHLLRRYFMQALAAVSDDESVLDTLWNVPWDE